MTIQGISLPAFRLVAAFFAAFSLDIARYAFEKSQQNPLATRTEIKQSLMTDLG